MSDDKPKIQIILSGEEKLSCLTGVKIDGKELTCYQASINYLRGERPTVLLEIPLTDCEIISEK